MQDRGFVNMSDDRMSMAVPDGWREEHKALVRTYRFADFATAFEFLTQVAAHAEAVDHHPEFTSRWNIVDFRLTSHDAGTITERDVELANAIDVLAAHTGA